MSLVQKRNKTLQNWNKVKKVVRCNMQGDRTPERWRRDVIGLFFDETKGTGDYYYAYEVERMSDGSAICLVRPTWKRGLDYFVVLKQPNGSISGPRFETIEKDLRGKRNAMPELYPTLHRALEQVHDGKDPDRVIKQNPQLSKLNATGLAVENILKITKWLFIDEDIKYWAYEGRDKWKASLDDIANRGAECH